MATKFNIKKVNPNVPVFSNYVACPDPNGLYRLATDCSITTCPPVVECLDCIEQGYYASCDECCPDPITQGYFATCDECCPEAVNYSLIDFQYPLIIGDQPDFEDKNWGVEGTEFFNSYIKPYERTFNLTGSIFKMYFSETEIVPTTTMSASTLTSSSSSGPRVNFVIPYVSSYSDEFYESSLNSGFGNEFRALGFTTQGIYTLIYHYFNEDKFVILNNFFQIN